MDNGIRTGDPRGFTKERSSNFRVGSRVRQTSEEGRGHIGWNVVEITIKMKTIVQKPLMTYVKLLEIELCDHLIVCKQMTVQLIC